MPWRRDSINPVAPRTRKQAKLLRETLTEPERKLWWHLRHRLPQSRTHFRKQVAIGPYIADFVCLGARLIVEQGFRVLRFSNGEVRREIDVVLDTIYAAIERSTPTPRVHRSAPHARPSPQGGGYEPSPQ
jgi:very-short-patch-repair endonuclease